jgi:hypothetical protein
MTAVSISSVRSPPVAPMRRVASVCSGQALVETCVVMAITILLFFGILMLARLLMASEILSHAAARGARAKTVGFNRWMIEKVIRVASIANAGEITEPAFDRTDPVLGGEMAAASSSGDLWDRLLRITPTSRQYDLERVKIPEYLASQTRGEALYVLNYSDWDTITATYPGSVPPSLLHVDVRQTFWMTNSLANPVYQAFYGGDSIPLRGTADIENHYGYYIDDGNR